MTIKELIEGIVSSITVNGDSFTFLHADKGWQNLISDESIFPVVYLDDPIAWKYSFTMGSVLEREYDLKILIGYKTELDFNPEEHQTEVEKAVNCCQQLINSLRQNKDIKIIKDVAGIEFTNAFDVNLSGVILYIKLHHRNSNPICV